jgi:hypothetical protein
MRRAAPVCCAATLVALASPVASAILYVAIALFYVLESSLFATMFRRT